MSRTQGGYNAARQESAPVQLGAAEGATTLRQKD
jgi:hypothetical protein